MPADSPNPAAAATADRRSDRWPLWSALVAIALAAAFLVVPALSGVPARMIEGCGKWIAAALVLELLSAVGFVVFFKLVFGAPMSWRRSVAAALRALGASAILPAGGLIGPTIGAWSGGTGAPAAAAAAAVLLYRGISLSSPVVLGAIGWTCSPAKRRLSVAGRRERFPRPARAKRREAAELATAPAD